MALTRSMLKGMNLTEEQQQAIIDAHMETVDGLKGQITKLTEKADRADALQKELDGMKGGTDWKAKHDALEKEFKAFKLQNEEKERAEAVKAAFKGLLKECNIDPKRIDVILRATNFDGMKLGEDGKLENADKLKEDIKRDWGDFEVTTRTRGADVSTPPEGGKVTRTKDEIMAIKDTAERQKAIAENPELFGI